MGKKEESWFSKAEARLYAYPALIAKHRREIEEYRQTAPAPKARNFTATSSIRGAAVGSEAERWVLSRERIAQKLLFLDQKTQDEIEKITALWEILTEKEQWLVNLKYFEQKSMFKILEMLNYSYQNCYKMRRRAVAKAAFIYGFIEYDEYLFII